MAWVTLKVEKQPEGDKVQTYIIPADIGEDVHQEVDIKAVVGGKLMEHCRVGEYYTARASWVPVSGETPGHYDIEQITKQAFM